jgi:2-dehydropantoate 2-reductase
MATIAILGPGGVGGFAAAALARAGGHRVIVVARESTAAVIARDGVWVSSARLGDFAARPHATAILAEPVDALMVTTKASGLDAALARIQRRPAIVVPLLNGLDHMVSLREWFGPGAVAAGTIRIESDRPAAGRIVQTSPSVQVELAADEPALGSSLRRVAEWFSDAGIPARVGASEAQILWSKLVRVNALACTTSAADRPIGFIRTDPAWRATLESCIAEAAAVANADGATIDPAERLAELDAAHPELGSSMQRDLAAGRESELDAIAGAVLRAAARHGLECPTVARLAAEIAARAGVSAP